MKIIDTFKKPSNRSAGVVGRGTAWLLFDAGGDLFQYQCYWMGGHCDDHLLEKAKVATDADAVRWAAARTPNARIRLPDHRTCWAGTGPPPAGFAAIWSTSPVAVHPISANAPDGQDQPEAIDYPSPADRRPVLTAA